MHARKPLASTPTSELVRRYNDIEERIDAMIESKRSVAEEVVGAGEGWLTELSNAELRDLFALGRDAVENGD